MVYPKWPFYEKDEITAVQNVLSSGKVNYWTGQECKLFEKEFASYCGVKHAISLANGTVALELALHALNIGQGDEVIVTPRTFIASISSIVVRGAKPIFADIDPSTQNISAGTISKVITDKTKAVILVHLAGWPCDMDVIMALTDKYGIKVIEDCAQAHGAKYKGKSVGSFGDIAAFSFCQDKIMSTGGEGGMLLCDDDELWKKAWSYKDHGKSYDRISAPVPGSGFRWLHAEFGTNMRMTEMQAAIGRIQLKKLDAWVNQRRSNADILRDFFSQYGSFVVPEPSSDYYHSYYKFYVFLKEGSLSDGWTRDSLVAEISTNGVPCFSGSCSEVYLEDAFERKHIRPKYRLKNAKKLGECSLMFLVHPTLGDKHMRSMCDILKNILIRTVR